MHLTKNLKNRSLNVKCEENDMCIGNIAEKHDCKPRKCRVLDYLKLYASNT